MNSNTLHTKLSSLIRICRARLSLPIALSAVLVVLVVVAAAAGYIVGGREVTNSAAASSEGSSVLDANIAQVDVSIEKELKASQNDIRITNGGVVRWTNNTSQSIEIAIVAHDYGEAFNSSLIIEAGAQGEHKFLDSGEFSYYLTASGNQKNAKILGYSIAVE